MRRFPLKEDAILDLAFDIINGFKKYPDLYPHPPVSVEELQKDADEFVKRREESLEAHAAANKANDMKDDALKPLKEKMKTELSYAEHAVNFNNADLKKIGWTGRTPKKPMEAPGACSDLKITIDGDTGDLHMKWDDSKKGGNPSFYKIMRLIVPESSWHFVDAVHFREAVLKEQPRGKTLKFRVIASNKVGDGAPSNTVTVTL